MKNKNEKFDRDVQQECQRDQERLEQIMASVLPLAQGLKAQNLPDQNATEMLTCRVPRDQHQALKAWCETENIRLSDWVRSRLYDTPLPPKNRPQSGPRPSQLDRQVIIELNRMGTNLNQLTRRLNSQPDSSVKSGDRQLLQTLLETLNQIQTRLNSSL